MGKRTTRIETDFLKDVRNQYLLQLERGEFSKVEFEGSSVYKPFSNFVDSTVYNFSEEVDKTIVCQWFILHNDRRFENYITHLLIPLNQIDIRSVEFFDILRLSSPHNISNLA